MVENIIRIDQKKPELKRPNSLNLIEEFKEGLVNTESKLGFIMKQNKVFSVDYLTQKENEIEVLQKSYYAKLMPLSNKSLLVIGGQSQPVRGGKANVVEVNRSAYELYWNDLTSQWRVKQRDYMNKARVGFGCTFIKNKSYAIVSGGYTTNF